MREDGAATCQVQQAPEGEAGGWPSELRGRVFKGGTRRKREGVAEKNLIVPSCRFCRRSGCRVKTVADRARGYYSSNNDRLEIACSQRERSSVLYLPRCQECSFPHQYQRPGGTEPLAGSGNDDYPGFAQKTLEDPASWFLKARLPLNCGWSLNCLARRGFAPCQFYWLI